MSKPIDPPPEPSTEVDAERISGRSELLPAERRAGSADTHAQAKAILADANDRTAEAVENPLTAGERHTSDEATDATSSI